MTRVSLWAAVGVTRGTIQGQRCLESKTPSCTLASSEERSSTSISKKKVSFHEHAEVWCLTSVFCLMPMHSTVTTGSL